jgi:hypothetical protein
MYLYQKDELALPGNLQSQKVFVSIVKCHRTTNVNIMGYSFVMK